MRRIPSIEQLRQRASMQALEAQYGRAAVVEALRAEAEAIRERVHSGHEPDDVILAIERAVPARLAASEAPSLRRVINATGVIVHTNLGRAPLARTAIERIEALASGYVNLEYDLAAGGRGRRDVHAERLLCRVSGAASAVVVNNNAAGTMLVLAALASGREVIVSRGELVEIGGGFRVPEIMAQSGAVLREVGTTNRTRAADYAAVISDRTGLILRVHPSNFRIEGFTERPRLEDLAALGRRFHVPVAEDLGSGYVALKETRPLAALGDEPDVAASIRAGADVVMFSGDKLLGGPQAGIIVGSEAAVSRVRSHPLMRALRVDKLTYAALEATLEEYLAGRSHETVPVQRMIALTAAEIGERAEAVAAQVREAGVVADILDGYSTIGGGSAPGSALPTRLLALTTSHADELLGRLRAANPPVIARIENERVVLDLRTVLPEEDDAVVAAIITAGCE